MPSVGFGEGLDDPRVAGVQASEDGRVVDRVFWVGQVWELGSSLPISKLACGLVLGLRALMGPIFEIGTPDPGCANSSAFEGIWE